MLDTIVTRRCSNLHLLKMAPGGGGVRWWSDSQRMPVHCCWKDRPDDPADGLVCPRALATCGRPNWWSTKSARWCCQRGGRHRAGL